MVERTKSLFFQTPVNPNSPLRRYDPVPAELFKVYCQRKSTASRLLRFRRTSQSFWTFTTTSIQWRLLVLTDDKGALGKAKRKSEWETFRAAYCGRFCAVFELTIDMSESVGLLMSIELFSESKHSTTSPKFLSVCLNQLFKSLRMSTWTQSAYFGLTRSSFLRIWKKCTQVMVSFRSNPHKRAVNSVFAVQCFKSTRKKRPHLHQSWWFAGTKPSYLVND